MIAARDHRVTPKVSFVGHPCGASPGTDGTHEPMRDEGRCVRCGVPLFHRPRDSRRKRTYRWGWRKIVTDQQAYDQIEGINWSRLKLLQISPKHFHATPPKKQTPAMRKGRAIHTLLLEPDNFDAEYVVWIGDRRGNRWKDFKAENSDRCILTDAEYDLARRCADAVLADPVASQVMRGGVSERAITWRDEETGRRCKGRPDHANGRVIDLKSTAVIEERRFSALCARLGYHAQLAFYRDGMVANGHIFDHEPALVVVQSERPHDVIVYELHEDVMEAGRREYRRLLRLLVECERDDHWPGIAGGEMRRLCLPEWAYHDPDDDVEITIGGVPIGI